MLFRGEKWLAVVGAVAASQRKIPPGPSRGRRDGLIGKN